MTVKEIVVTTKSWQYKCNFCGTPEISNKEDDLPVLWDWFIIRNIVIHVCPCCIIFLRNHAPQLFNAFINIKGTK